jgi:enterochelin esterase family protein
MNKAIISCSLILVTLFGVPEFAIAQTPRNVPPAFESYEVHKDNKVTFRFYAPNAKEVKVSTQLAAGAQQMIKGDNGVWAITLGPVKPDMYPYNFQVDGIQVADPRNTAIFPNEGFQNSIIEITGDAPLVHTIQDVPHGTLSYRFYSNP